jgi:hypothetical protein
MGLDIYCHRISYKVATEKGISLTNEDMNELYQAMKEESKKEFINKTSKLLANLKKVALKTPDKYYDEYPKFIDRLKKLPFYKCYHYRLDNFGFNAYRNEYLGAKTPTEVEVELNKDYANYSLAEDAYFRKVNFIYAFFSNELYDECCLVDKTRIKELIDTCEDVLKHKNNINYATEHLPTTSGFFFGSTEYDKWYWEDVKECLKQMKKLYKKLDDMDMALWIFSW